jgi:SAM-dependent methyltransferase
MMDDKDEVRKSVSEFYTQAVKGGSWCCGPASSGCCGSAAAPEVVAKGFAAQFAGYGADTVGLPADAVENSFGCGNPLAFSGVLPGEVVLDLGSGAGIDLLIAARKVGLSGRVIGVDMTDEMIDRARANADAAGFPNIEVRKGIIENLPVESGSVDWVISNCVINLSPEKDRVFAEIARVLKPGGRMSVSDIVVQDVPDWVRQSMALYASCVAGAVSEDEYAASLRRAGLADVEVAERFPYDLEQVRSLIESEVPGAIKGSIDTPALAAEVAEKVWSVKFHARKPLEG